MALSGRPIGLAFKLLMVVAMVAGLLVVVPQAQAQGASTPGGQCTTINGANYCIDKTVSPAQATVGQPITFTITVGLTNCSGALCGLGADTITDTLPAGVTLVSATAISTSPFAGIQPTCTNAGNTVTCTPLRSEFTNVPAPQAFPSIATIVVTPTQCGTFTNTATSLGFGISASADFTVGCATPPPQQQQQQQQQHQPTCPPASIETASEPQSGNVSLSGGAQNSGDYAHQVTPSVQTGDTGNMVNSPSVLQSCGSQSGAIEPGGISKDINPVVDVSSPSTIEQSSGSNN